MTARFRSCGILIVLALLLSVVVTQAHASVLVNFTGNTAPKATGSTGEVQDGHINFMVLDQTLDTGDIFQLPGLGSFVQGTSSAGLDTSARYLYLFQTVNDGTSNLFIGRNRVGHTGTQYITSFGHFAGSGFTWDGVLTNASGTGSIWLGGTSALATNPSPAYVNAAENAAKAGTANNSDAIAPLSVVLTASSLEANYASSLNPPELAFGKVSVLWGYTSNEAPLWQSAGIIDGGVTANGTVPGTAIPEPVSLAIWSLMAVGGAAAAASRRRRRGRWSNESRVAIHRVIERN